MIGRPGWWTQTPSTIPLRPIKWNAHFWITFNFWWSAGLVNGLEPHPPPLSSQNSEMLIFVLHSTCDVGQTGQWTWTPSTTLPSQKMKFSFLGYVHLLMISQAVRWTQTPSASPLQPIKWNAHFCITFIFWWSAGLVNGLEPHPPPVSCQKNEMLIFWLCSTSDDWLGWSMDSNPIHHPSPPKKMKCSFLDYIQLLMIGRAGQWTETPSATSLQPKTWNATFWITFNFWWSAGLVNGLKPHLPPLSSQKSDMLIFVLHSTSDVGQTGQWTWTSSTTPLQPKKWNAHFWITLNFWWSAGLVNGLEPHPPPVSSQKNEMLIFWLCSTSDVGQTGQWTQTPSTTPLQPKKMKCSFLDYVHFWWCAWLIDELELHLPPLSSNKNEMLNFRLRSTSDDQPSWSIDSKSICHPSPAKKMKCSFLDYVQLLMISWASQWT